MKLKSIIFRMRCLDVLNYTVVKALQDGARKIKFWEIAQPTSRYGQANQSEAARATFHEIPLGATQPRRSDAQRRLCRIESRGW